MDEKAESNVLKQAQLLASDAIQNYKTVSSFANENIITDEFGTKIAAIEKKDSDQSHCFAFSFGASNGLTNIIFGVLYYIGSLLRYHYPDNETLSEDKIFIAMLSILFGSFAASGATMFMPDVDKAKIAAAKICTVLETPSLIDPIKTSSDAETIKMSSFKGASPILPF